MQKWGWRFKFVARVLLNYDRKAFKRLATDQPPFQVCLVLDDLFDVPSKILNVASGLQLKDHIQVVLSCFFKRPIPDNEPIDPIGNLVFWSRQVNKLERLHIVYTSQQ